MLFNGRIWRNSYYQIDGDQFLFSKDFLPGSVTINGKLFNQHSLSLKLNIFNDELLTVTDSGTVLQLNKEMVDYFTLEYENKVYPFKRLDTDSLNVVSGYVQVLYNGGTLLFVKHKKEIRLRETAAEKDTFIHTYRIYVMKDGIIGQVHNKKTLMRTLGDQKEQLRDFLRSGKIRLSKNNPASFAPVLEFYDGL